MSNRRKKSRVSYTKVARFFLALFLLFFLAFSITQKLNAVVNKVNITIATNDDNKTLIDKKDVRYLLKAELGYDINIAETAQLNLFKLESMLNRDDRINKADLYLDKHNNLHISIEQKQPIVRIDVTNGHDYYLDYKGEQIPVTDVFRVPVVTGHVDNYVPQFKKMKTNNLNGVLEVAQRIHDDAFLTALVEQIYVDEKSAVTIVPKVGRDKILLGQIEDMDEKIYKLKVYYEKGIKNIGIDKFDELDLQYKGQILERDTDT